MNLKESFRYQNKLQHLMLEAENILSRPQNITRVHNTYLRKKVMPEVEDETIEDTPATEYSEHITELAEFLLFLLGEHEKLTAAIHAAKSAMTLEGGLDGQVSLNASRQRIANLLRQMASLRSSEQLLSGGGPGYHNFNEILRVAERLCPGVQDKMCEKGWLTKDIGEYFITRHCSMCGETFNFWDNQESFCLNRVIGFGSAYDLHRIRLNLCCKCFDKVMDLIIPQCKHNPIT